METVILKNNARIVKNVAMTDNTSLTVSLVSKRYMRGVAEMKFGSLFVRI